MTIKVTVTVYNLDLIRLQAGISAPVAHSIGTIHSVQGNIPSCYLHAIIIIYVQNSHNNFQLSLEAIADLYDIKIKLRPNKLWPCGVQRGGAYICSVVHKKHAVKW